MCGAKCSGLFMGKASLCGARGRDCCMVEAVIRGMKECVIRAVGSDRAWQLKASADCQPNRTDFEIRPSPPPFKGLYYIIHHQSGL